jgi:DNA-binding LacI/PurR family transcriptional regulator
MTQPRKSSTIRDVARLADVSVATVSRYINNSAPLAEETGKRVQQAMDELRFSPHPIAQNLATKRTNTLGLLLLDIGGSFYTPLLRGIESVSSEAGFDLLIHSTRGSQAGLRPRRALTEHNTDGLLIFIDALDNAELTRLNEIGFPVVLMHQSPPAGLDIPVVTIENQAGACQIVDHLIEAHGRKRIAFLQGPEENEDSEARERGYRQALKKHNIAFDPALVARGGFDTEGAFIATKILLDSKIPFDAIFTGDDDSAIGVLDALKVAGLNVPADVSVAGFDDSIFSRLLSPSLTTVRSPIEMVGREAVAQLIHQIRGEPTNPRTVLQTEMILRQSCGCDR